MDVPICRWSTIPVDECPHCTGNLDSLDPPASIPAPMRQSHILTAMRMPAFRTSDQQYDVVIGPCPGCDAWQIDYTSEVAATYAEIEMPEAHEFGSDQPILMDPVIDMRPFHAVIEEALREHLAECPHLQQIVDEL